MLEKLLSEILDGQSLHSILRELWSMAATRLRVLRIARGLKLQTVAEATRLSVDYLAKLERGDLPLTARAGRILAKYYGEPAAQLDRPSDPPIERLQPFIEIVAELVAERVLARLKEEEDRVSS